MKKAISICIVCFLSMKAFSQTDEMFTEEKSSGWLKITTPVKPAARTSSKSTQTTRIPKNKPSTQQPKPAEIFNKTNDQVKRFKKEEN